MISSKVDVMFLLWTSTWLDSMIEEFQGLEIEEFWDRLSGLYDRFEALQDQENAELRVEIDGQTEEISV